MSQTRRKQLALLITSVLANGFAEIISLSAVVPFLGVITSPEKLLKNGYIRDISEAFAVRDSSQLVLPITLVFVGAIIATNCIRILNLWLSTQLAAAIGSDISREVYKRTLYQDFEVHIQRNSSSLIAAVTDSTYRTILALRALLQMMTSSVIAGCLFLGLLTIEFSATIYCGTLISGVYIILAIRTKKILLKNSNQITASSRFQVKALQEGLGGIREVILDGSQEYYLQQYTNSERPQRRLQAKNLFIAGFPRYVLELLGLITVAALGAILVLKGENPASVIATLGVLALGSQRLLPALQQIYASWAAANSYSSDLKTVSTFLEQPYSDTATNPTKPLEFKSEIEFRNVSFGYNSRGDYVLNNLNFTIHKGEKIGIVGTTGSGKSTLIDLLMGLLNVSQGSILVDGKEVNCANPNNLRRSWQSHISHVPQMIFLADTTIAQNIALGQPLDAINMDTIKSAGKIAQVTEFVSSLPIDYQTQVGERGIQLSGGQRQRIGLARALYKMTEILILDEATSALDSFTEKKIMEQIGDLRHNVTIIMVAHRLSTLESCDRIFAIEKGRVKAIGTPEVILAQYINEQKSSGDK